MTSPTPELVLAAAVSQIGYKEGANNDNKYGKWFGLNNVSWCAEFVSWCFAQANGTALIPAQYKTGFCGCPGAVTTFRNRKAFVTPDKARPGDVCFYDWDRDGISDHTGIIESVDLKARTVTCIEGNTGDGKNQSDGDGVYRRTRPFTQVLGVGRITWPATTQA